MGWMKATISLKEALDILEEKYKKEYDNGKEVKVKFYPAYYSYSYTDWGGFTEDYSCYVVNSEIKYIKLFGSLVANGSITKNCEEIKKDLIDELRKNYCNDEYEIKSLGLPSFKTNELNYEKEVEIWFGEKSKKLVK